MFYSKLSIIIPCFNEEAVIKETYKRVKGVLLENKYLHEILFINDGSKDNTLDILKQIAFDDTDVKIISFSRNFGHQAGVSAGINNCSGDLAIIIDADMQDPPELFPEMIKKYQEESCNVVFGVRKTREGETFFKKIAAKIFYRMINKLSETELPLDTGDFRLIDKNIIDAFKSFKESNKYVRGIISWMGFKQVPFYYDRPLRLLGETKYPLSKMIKFALTGVFYFSKKPLKLAMTLGFLCIVFGLLLTAFVVYGKYSGNIVPGWTSIIITIIFFGGIQLLTVGVIGEYIGNIFDEVKNRPEYIINTKINL